MWCYSASVIIKICFNKNKTNKTKRNKKKIQKPQTRLKCKYWKYWNMILTLKMNHSGTKTREVNSRLSGWATAHLVNYFAHPVNRTCPLPKIAHLVQYLAQRGKIDTAIITNRHFRPNFLQNWLIPSWKQHSGTFLNRQYLSAVQKLVNISV